MDRPELRKKITDIFNNPQNYVNKPFKVGEITCDDYHLDRLKVTDQIVAFFAGWRSEEKVKELIQDEHDQHVATEKEIRKQERNRMLDWLRDSPKYKVMQKKPNGKYYENLLNCDWQALKDER